MKLKESVAAALKAMRLENNLTQAQVFKDTGIHIGRIESGLQDIQVNTLMVLCERYKVKPSAMFKQIEDT